ncbi:MAG: type II toxin-antitoxin system RelB/DinJ family antitoxin [Lachnospiraceae bacterium]|nr:type II toxin-antitoxin system RelB/DinJ family antitoxin [Lachnospiraceae bacterium]
MDKNHDVFTNMDPDIKKNAEEILLSLGLSPSMAIEAFYRQVILWKGLPFELRFPANRMPDLNPFSGLQTGGIMGFSGPGPYVGMPNNQAAPYAGVQVYGMMEPGVQNPAMQSAFSQNAATQSATPQNSAMQSAAPQNSAMQSAAPQNSAMQSAAPQNASMQSAAPQNSSMQSAPPQNSSMQSAAPQNAAIQNAAPQNAAIQNAAPQNAAMDGGGPENSDEQVDAPRQIDWQDPAVLGFKPAAKQPSSPASESPTNETGNNSMTGGEYAEEKAEVAAAVAKVLEEVPGADVSEVADVIAKTLTEAEGDVNGMSPKATGPKPEQAQAPRPHAEAAEGSASNIGENTDSSANDADMVNFAVYPVSSDSSSGQGSDSETSDQAAPPSEDSAPPASPEPVYKADAGLDRDATRSNYDPAFDTDHTVELRRDSDTGLFKIILSVPSEDEESGKAWIGTLTIEDDRLDSRKYQSIMDKDGFIPTDDITFDEKVSYVENEYAMKFRYSGDAPFDLPGMIDRACYFLSKHGVQRIIYRSSRADERSTMEELGFSFTGKNNAGWTQINEYVRTLS